MSEPTPLYTIRRHVMDTDADIARRQKLSSIFGMFQDVASAHADNLGAAVEWLHKEENLAWILMRIRVEVDRYPTLAQEVVVETWPQAPRALYERDYVIRDTEGEALVRAASTWIIMNLETREIKRDKFLDYYGIEMIKARAIGRSVGRLKPAPDAELCYEKEIRFSDVDYNSHVNNAKYVDFVMDSFSIAEHKEREIKAIEMHYINEAGPDEVLQIRRQNMDEGNVYVDGVRKPDGAYVFSALTEWREGQERK